MASSVPVEQEIFPNECIWPIDGTLTTSVQSGTGSNNI